MCYVPMDLNQSQEDIGFLSGSACTFNCLSLAESWLTYTGVDWASRWLAQPADSPAGLRAILVQGADLALIYASIVREAQMEQLRVELDFFVDTGRGGPCLQRKDRVSRAIMAKAFAVPA